MLHEENTIDFRRKEKTEDAEMDMTPMVDVTFLLLIFFMVTAAFTMQKSFEVPTPKSDQASTTAQNLEEDNDVIVVRVDEFNTFHVLAPAWDDEREAPSKQDLLVSLREARQSGSVSKLLVKAHGDAVHEKVIMVMDAGTSVGMDDVKLMTVEDDAY